jgi:transcriptional regulator with XRE-family HTH domain
VTRDLDPSASPLEFFGAELRLRRIAAGLSQDQLAERISFSPALVSKVETGDRAPAEEFAIQCDIALDAGGLFHRLFTLARRWDGGYPWWFVQWREIEAAAESLRWFEPLLIPGLLQVPAYTAALVDAWHSADSEEDREGIVSARMERQEILARPRPPSLSVVIDEQVLYRHVGDHAVMERQFGHLLVMTERPRVTIQVLPAQVGAHAGLLGAFIIATEGNSGSVYLESPNDEGTTIKVPETVARMTEKFDILRADALPRGESRELIRKVAEQWA